MDNLSIQSEEITRYFQIPPYFKPPTGKPATLADSLRRELRISFKPYERFFQDMITRQFRSRGKAVISLSSSPELSVVNEGYVAAKYAEVAMEILEGWGFKVTMSPDNKTIKIN